MTNEKISWRKSSYSGDGGTGGGNCVEAAWLADGRTALRDSKNPSAGTVFVTLAWLDALKEGKFDL